MWKNIKNIIYVKNDYIWNAATCCCENGEYLANIMDDSDYGQLRVMKLQTPNLSRTTKKQKQFQ